MSTPSLDIAVVGAGVAGLTAAYALQQRHRVTLYERAKVPGGHAHTHVLTDGPDAGTPLDVAFMVLNDRNYPTFHRLLARLRGIAVQPSEMSFGYQSLDGAVQYAINWAPGYAAGLGWSTPPRPPEPLLLAEIVRFFRRGAKDLAAGLAPDLTYGDYLSGRGLSAAFVEGYALPMGAALWSSAPRDVLAAPAAFVLDFYRHHGMLSLDDGPRWQTITGGSRTYVDRLVAALTGPVKLGVYPLRASRGEAGVSLHLSNGGMARHDQIVLATHADEALALLADASPEERALLGAWRYQRSHAVLHSDPRFMPTDRGAWASWNYVQHLDHALAEGPTLTYHLDRLQALTGLARPYFLTLNPAFEPTDVQARFDFTHPVYSVGAIASQAPLAALSGTNRTHFCGNYLGAGFHEDGARAGLAVAWALGTDL